jgi:hypothetical protein
VRRLGVLILCALALPVGQARAWTWPVDGPVVRGFSFDRDHPYAAGEHRGIDIRAVVGEDVLSPAAGVVSFAGTVPSGGKTISIRTASGTTVTLLHLGSIDVRRGALVNEAAVVGSAAPSDDPELTEPHVYLGIRTSADPQGYLDPLDFLPARPAPTAAGEPSPTTRSSGSLPADPAPAAEPAPAAAAPEAVKPAAGSEPAVEAAPVIRTAAEPRTHRAEGHAATKARVGMTEATEADPVLRVTGDERAHRSVEHEGRTLPEATAPISVGRSVANAMPHDPARVATAPQSSAAVERRDDARHPWWPGLVVGALAIACTGAWLRRRGGPNPARMMDLPQPENAFARNESEERPRRACLAVCVGTEAPGSRRGVRGSGGHLRSLPAAEGEPGADGERDGRARDTGDGHGGPGRRLAA